MTSPSTKRIPLPPKANERAKMPRRSALKATFKSKRWPKATVASAKTVSPASAMPMPRPSVVDDSGLKRAAMPANSKRPGSLPLPPGRAKMRPKSMPTPSRGATMRKAKS